MTWVYLSIAPQWRSNREMAAMNPTITIPTNHSFIWMLVRATITKTETGDLSIHQVVPKAEPIKQLQGAFEPAQYKHQL